jgi:hypothetical protein
METDKARSMRADRARGAVDHKPGRGSMPICHGAKNGRVWERGERKVLCQNGVAWVGIECW